MKDQIKLFSHVKCKAYMEKARDGVSIQMCDAGLDHPQTAKAVRYNDETHEYDEIADLSGFDGSSVEKTYMQRVEAEFNGFVVGYRKLKVRGRIGTDWNDGPYGNEYGYCFKYVTDRPTVAVVYYKNNCKRYVLPEDMEEITLIDNEKNCHDCCYAKHIGPDKLRCTNKKYDIETKSCFVPKRIDYTFEEMRAKLNGGQNDDSTRTDL